MLRRLLIALALASAGSAAQAGEPDPWLNGERAICLSYASGDADKARPAGNIRAITILLGAAKTAKDPGWLDANIRVGFADSERQYSMSMTCGPTGAGGEQIRCNIPCGGDAAISLSTAPENRARADIVVETGLLADTKATGAKGEMLELLRRPLDDCLGRNSPSNPPTQ